MNIRNIILLVLLFILPMMGQKFEKSGGARTINATNNPDNSSLEAKPGNTIGFKDSYLGRIVQAKDSTTAKGMTIDSLGTRVWIRASYGGSFILLDSATVRAKYGSGSIRGYISYPTAIAGKRLYREELINRGWLNAMMFGADPTGSVDATTALQTALNVADATTNQFEWLPTTTLKISSTIRIPLGVNIRGARGSWNASAEAEDNPRVLWYGAAGDTMFAIYETDMNFQNFNGPVSVYGASGGNRAGIMFYCRAGIDLGDTWNYVQFHSADTLLYLRGGVTNFHMRDFRMDNMQGCGIYVRQRGGSGNMSLSNFTIDCGDAGEPNLVYIDMDPSSDNNILLHLQVSDTKIEVNNEPATPFNGIIRVNNDVTSFPQLYSTSFLLSNVWIAPKSGVDSFSVVSFVNATDYMSVVAHNFNSGTTSTSGKIIHNSVTAPIKNYGRFTNFVFAPYYNSAVYAQGMYDTFLRVKRLKVGGSKKAMFGATTNPPYFSFGRSYTLKATPDSGMVEYDGDFMYLTNKAGTRRKVGSIYGTGAFTTGQNVDTVSFVSSNPNVVTTNSWANITFKSDPDTSYYVTFKADSMFVHYSGAKTASGTKTYYYEVK